MKTVILALDPVLIEIIKYSVPAIVVFLVSFVSLRQYLQKEYQIKKLEYKMASMRDAKPVRLQAYERMALFLERVALNNLLYRVRANEMNVRDFQLALLKSIRSEFEHNVTQQIYVSAEMWNMTRASKEEVISIVNRVAAEVPPHLPSIELSKRIFAHLIEEEKQPTAQALEYLKKEVMELY